MEYLKNTVRSLDVDHIIYFHNLNDTLPDKDRSARARLLDEARKASLLTDVINVLRVKTEGLRSTSYLFNWMRYKVRILLLGLGIEHNGEEPYEFYPERNKPVIQQTAARIRYLNRMPESEGIGFLVVLVPYEMQISEEAARVYAAMGIHWERGFLGRRLQQIIRQALAPAIRVIDAYEAFVAERGDREEIGVGELFVYNEGDSLDWNHLNRAGHKKTADFLENNTLFLGTIKGR